ncbi:Alpha-galactosidase [Colletotrichum higginsianum IMI 349063]|uniref:Alpha-galactosidase n=1 Tax=Colletotrichum higginsianum (strain IMI 349063) TaxID=759273 RepID=A0A1B7Y9K9_COLHI|nr:Alpha-galactosidase [Colletotrichum higginsianum IMI 349063]OBR08781.1 Alpha-galactosidase [Colletotrichum higginsianum IMI 349063]GJC97156.1 alpha-galactosidase [Colletotrichum higginsianum]
MALKSPLIISTEVPKIRELSPRIIPLNEDITTVSQNERGDAVWYLPGLSTEGAVQVWEGGGGRVGNVSACCSGPGLWAER